MKKMATCTALVLALLCNVVYAQTAPRVVITSITPSVNTGQDYTPWLNDDITNMVTNLWSSFNNQYIDVKLKLQTRVYLTKVSLYHYSGNFDDYPASIYAVNGSVRTLLGTFQGDFYMQWVD